YTGHDPQKLPVGGRANSNLVSKTTMDTLRRFRYDPETQDEETCPAQANMGYGYGPTMRDVTITGPCDDVESCDPPLSPKHGRDYNHGAVANHLVGSEQGSPCPNLIYGDELDTDLNSFCITQPEDPSSPTISPNTARNAPSASPGFCDDEMDEVGLAALAELCSQVDSSVGVPWVTSPPSNHTMNDQYTSPAAFAQQPTGVPHPYEYDSNDAEYEYAVDPEYFNPRPEVPPPQNQHLSTCYSNSFPNYETDGPTKTFASQSQLDILSEDDCRDPRLSTSAANGLTNYASPLRSTTVFHRQPRRKVTPHTETHQRGTGSYSNGHANDIKAGAQAKTPASQSTDSTRSNHSRECLELSTVVSTRPQPFLRHAFPTPVRGHSHIQGLSSRTVLRTCFRIGEAMKASLPATSTANSGGQPAPRTTLIELYAIVSASYLCHNRQFFTFSDLFFPRRPPYLTGIWVGENPSTKDSRRNRNSDEKGDLDSICRVLGIVDSTSMRTRDDNSNGQGTTMAVLGIWRADWADVEYVKGIVEA
ncbi:hypothetical protein FQN54_001594, partial [Arachnomyces sp. PD_36]